MDDQNQLRDIGRKLNVSDRNIIAHYLNNALTPAVINSCAIRSNVPLAAYRREALDDTIKTLNHLTQLIRLLTQPDERM